MDKPRLQFPEYGCDFFRSLFPVYFPGIVWSESFLEHLACEANQGARAIGGRQNENVARVKPGTPLIVRDRRVDIYRTHSQGSFAARFPSRSRGQ
jgi:hypothetical protein